MKLSNNVLKKILLPVLLTVLALFGALVVYFDRQTSTLASDMSALVDSTLTSGQVKDPGLPVRLKIPSIKVDAAFEYVGVTAAGLMDIPKGPDEVGWYELGPRPGERGSAVIAGHYGTWRNGQGSVFDDLNELKPGDKVFIEDDGGKTIPFVVRESREYDPSADSAEVFFSDDGKSHLNLITCEGAWNKDSKSYSKRRVIFAERE